VSAIVRRYSRLPRRIGPVQFAVTSTGAVSDLDTAFEASSNTNVAFNRIPEPGTLGLLGIALAGLVLFRSPQEKRLGEKHSVFKA